MDHLLQPALPSLLPLSSIRIRVQQSLIPGGGCGGGGASNPDSRQNVTRSNNVMAMAVFLSADGCEGEGEEGDEEEGEGHWHWHPRLTDTSLG